MGNFTGSQYKIVTESISFKVFPPKPIDIYRGLYEPIQDEQKVDEGVYEVDDTDWRKAYLVPDFVLWVSRSLDQKDALLISAQEYKPAEIINWLQDNF